MISYRRSARSVACLIAALLMHGPSVSRAQVPTDQTLQGIGVFAFAQNGFDLKLINQFEGLTKATATKLTSVFFNAILNECTMFDWACSKNVTLRLVPSIPLCGIGQNPHACASGTNIDIAFVHLTDYPLDYDVVTHEAMHVVQQYGSASDACAYWREGLADFARDRFGKDNGPAQWALRQGNSYTESYIFTGHFLRWVAQQYGDSRIVALHQRLKSGTCPDDKFWQDQTSLELDALWTKYAGKAPTRTRTVDPTQPGDGEQPPFEPEEVPSEPQDPPFEPEEVPSEPEEPQYPGDEYPGDEYPGDEYPGDEEPVTSPSA